VIGYPNVGKSSVINTLISKKSCKVAPIPGETKIWQYITLFRNIYLIDCPGVVVDAAGDTETDSVLKGVVRAERLETPEDFIDAIQLAVKRDHIAAMYGLPKSGDETWTTSGELLEKIAMKSGRLLKGGEPCLRTAAIMVICDYQRGRLPHYVAPPELKEDSGKDDNTLKKKDGGVAGGLKDMSKIEGVTLEPQDLDSIHPSKTDDDLDEGDEQVINVSDNECLYEDKIEATESLAKVGAGEWD
jgi:nuclear GTP-binding protein